MCFALVYFIKGMKLIFYRFIGISKEVAIFQRKLESNHAQRKEVLCLLIVLRFDNHLKLFLRLVILLMLML